MRPRSLPSHLRARGVTAILGPTNTGKTHLAIERLVAHSSGAIGLPLRLLAREVYNRVVERVGADAVALVTGEEKIKPDRARYWIATVEAMPRDLDVAFVAIDEVQLAADLDRGHIFTDRLLNYRGREETLIIGASTMRPLIETLIPGVQVVTRPRLSTLSFAGDKKVSRLPPRSAIVAFSAEEVYAIAELIRRYRGGAAVVLGALSPRTRNSQVALFEAGDVDYLVATDAIGMGLNLDLQHVAFAGRQKFDGFHFRDLHPAELGQIAGRAGRHMRDGTFGSTGRCEPFDPEIVDALENHRFEPVKIAQWRNPDLDTRTLASLQASLAEVPREPGLTRALVAEDEASLAILSREDDTARLASGRERVERLWEVCGLPDYRRVSPVGHADLVGGIFRDLAGPGRRIPADWFARQLATVDRTDGEIDTLSQRLAHVRTWSFVANRPDWLADPEHWQGVTRRIEDSLSDALHERLAARFVDRRTSVLMRRLREKARMEAEITASGDVTVEGEHVGHLLGFSFVPDPAASGQEAKAALRNAAAQALAGEIEARAERFSAAPDASIVLSNDGMLRWTGDPVAKLEPGDHLYRPSLRILADEQLTGPARDKVEARLKAWLKAHVARLLGPALDLETAADLTGLARGIAFRISEGLGMVERSRIAGDMRSLDTAGRAALRSKGVRFGAYHVYLPALIKPGPRNLATQLWALGNGGLDQKGIDEIAHLAGSGRTSFPVDPEVAKGLYRAAGFRAFPTRAVRIDILERLADLIRPAIAYRPGTTPGEPPPGAADEDGFVQTGAMTSLVGTSGEGFAEILRSLGYASETREGPAITVALVPARTAAMAPAAEPSSSEGSSAADATAEAPAAETPLAGTVVEDGATSEADEPAPDVGGEPEIAPPEGAVVDPALEAAADEILAEAEPLGDEIEADAPPAGHVFEDGPLDVADEPDPGVQDEPDAAAPPAPENSGLADPRPDEVAEAAPDLAGTEDIRVPASGDEADESPAGEAATDLAPTPDMEAASMEAAEAGPGAVDATVPISDGDVAALGAPERVESEAAPATPQTVDIWRLQRFRREHNPRGRDVRRGEGRERRPGGGERRAEPGRPEAGRPEGGRPEGGRPDAGRPAGGGPGRGFGGPRGPGGAFGRDRGPGGFPRPSPGGGAPEGRPPREARPSGGAPGGSEARPSGPRRDDRFRPAAQRDERPRREPRERQPDPDSPFAKLAALKAQLEKDRDGR